MVRTVSCAGPGMRKKASKADIHCEGMANGLTGREEGGAASQIALILTFLFSSIGLVDLCFLFLASVRSLTHLSLGLVQGASVLATMRTHQEQNISRSQKLMVLLTLGYTDYVADIVLSASWVSRHLILTATL